MAAARSAAAAIVLAGGRDVDSVAKAIDFVERFTGLDLSERHFTDDLADPHLPTRLRGDMTLLAESLTPIAAAQFVEGMTSLVRTCSRPDDAMAVPLMCSELLGVTRKRNVDRKRHRS
jgi:hypothetical protein